MTVRVIEFVNNQAKKNMCELPEWVSTQFMVELDSVAHGNRPSLEIDHLTSVGKGAIEIKINGRPAYRCVYTNKLDGKLVILHAFKKTTNGPDTHNCEVARQRLKELLSR